MLSFLSSNIFLCSGMLPPLCSEIKSISIPRRNKVVTKKTFVKPEVNNKSFNNNKNTINNEVIIVIQNTFFYCCIDLV